MVNAGSWLCVIEVDNIELENLINQGVVKGLSLFSYANGESSYNDIKDKEDVYPLFISFVKYPANQVIFEVLDKDSYISKMEDVNLADEKSIIEKIKDLISSVEDETNEKIIEKAEDENAKAEPGEAVETQEEVPKVEEEVVNKAEKETDDETKVEPVEKETESEETVEPASKEPEEEDKGAVEKACGDDEVVEKEGEIISGATNDDILNAINDLKNVILQALTPEEPKEEEVVEEVVEEPEEPETYIIKQATQKTDIIDEQKVEKKQYFDILGRKL